MKAAVVRKLASERTLDELESAIERVSEGEPPPFDPEGADEGEGLTHLLLAARIRRRVEAGEDIKDAFRKEMSAVREVLQNATPEGT